MYLLQQDITHLIEDRHPLGAVQDSHSLHSADDATILVQNTPRCIGIEFMRGVDQY